MALTDNLISVWHMNNDWLDSWGTNHGTAYGATFSASAKLGSHAGSFDGVDDYVSVANHASLNITGNLTLSAWVYLDDFVNINTIMGKWWPAGYQYVLLSYNQKAYFAVYIAGVEKAVESTAILAVGTWYHFVGIRDGTSLKLYVDGVFKTNLTIPATDIDTGSQTFQLGRRENLNSQCLDGLIDEAAIWSRAITDGGIAVGQTATGEVAELFNLGVGVELGAGQPINLRGAFIPGMRQWQPNMLRR